MPVGRGKILTCLKTTIPSARGCHILFRGVRSWPAVKEEKVIDLALKYA